MCFFVRQAAIRGRVDKLKEIDWWGGVRRGEEMLVDIPTIKFG